MSKSIDFVELQEVATKAWARNRLIKVAPLQKRHCSEIILLRNFSRNPPQPLPKPSDLLHRVVNHRFCGTGPTHTYGPDVLETLLAIPTTTPWVTLTHIPTKTSTPTSVAYPAPPTPRGEGSIEEPYP
jgi:hypothetical protein